MIPTLPALSPSTPTGPAAIASRGDVRPIPGLASAAVAAVPSGSDTLTQAAVEPAQALEEVATAAAQDLFPDRDVDVRSFYDQGADRFVYQVADRSTGELLVELPPDDLLRFYASSRAGEAAEPVLQLRA